MSMFKYLYVYNISLKPSSLHTLYKSIVYYYIAFEKLYSHY